MGWWMLCALAWASFAGLSQVTPEAAETAWVIRRFTPPAIWKLRALHLVQRLSRRLPGYDRQVQLEMAVLRVEPTRYFQQMVLFGGGAAIWCAFEISVWAAPIGILVGVAGIRQYLGWRYRRWLELCAAEVGELVTLLKARMQAGDTVAQAMRGASSQLMDPLAAEWQRAIAGLDSGQTLAAVVQDLQRRMAHRDIHAVLTQLMIYDRDAIPADPFGTLAGHLSRMKLLKREYLIKRATGGLTIFEGLAFLGAVLTLGLPGAYVFWTHAVSGGLI